MPSSISSSEGAGPGTITSAAIVPWRRFFKLAVATAAGLSAAVYLFIVIVDPWDTLPLSPSWKRAPMSTNQRYAYASLVRSPAFDSILLGTSTVRLLRPPALNAALGGHFANLAMNSATPYEQSRILGIFLRTHSAVRTVMVGVDFRWCEAKVEKYFYQMLPEWMYQISQWGNYRHIFSLYALQESFPQLAYMLGLRRARFALDGYGNFLPDDRRYDPARAAAALGPLLPEDRTNLLRDGPDLRFPALDHLSRMLAMVPPATRTILVFTPNYRGTQSPPGMPSAEQFAACKFRVAQMARKHPGTMVIDFMIDSSITRKATNYWDYLHYRIDIAERLVADLGAAAKGDGTPPSEDYRILAR